MHKVTNRVLSLLRALSSPFIRLVEKFLLSKYRNASSQGDPIFIIGSPRTGSTILYQALTNLYEISYIDNLACKWYRNLPFGIWLSKRKFGNRPHNNFESFLGNTTNFGAHAPSECGAFWYRWLPKAKHFIDYEEITEKMVSEIRWEIAAAAKLSGTPLLFKNLNAGQRLRLISKAFPNAKIIFVRRDPRFVTRSILRARKAADAQPNQWWSIMPPNVSELRSLPEDAMCAAQVYYLEDQIKKDLSLFQDRNIRTLHFQDFSEDLIREIAQWLKLSPRRGGQMPAFRPDNVSELDPYELQSLGNIVRDYPFEQELFH